MPSEIFGIRSSLRTPPTIGDMERAIESRYFEATRLIVSSDHTHSWGGTYLLGYVGEMVLKMAYFKLKSCQPADDAWAILRTQAQKDATEFGIVNRERDFDFHSLVHLMDLVLMTRRALGMSCFNRISSSDLATAVVRLNSIWKVSMRYYGSVPLAIEVQEAYEDASWLRTHAPEIWR